MSQMIWLGACSHVPYYAQAVDGHFRVIHRAQPISKVIANPDTDPKLKHSLAKVVQLREFASREAELKKLAARGKELEAQLAKGKPNDSERRAMERELASVDREYQAKSRDFRDDLNQRRNEEFAAVQERANRVIRQLAEREQFDLILQDVVYVSGKMDITPKVLKELEK